MTRFSANVLLLLLVASIAVDGRDMIRLPSETSRFFSGDDSNDGDDDSVGTRWAVLLAGSSGYWNYRHQADVCHAYQLLKKGGLKDENIVVFMYDDIAFNEENPRPGVIINSPHGSDVYSGVPKDYIGDDVTVNNFFAVILGNKTALTGGSGKVVDSGPNDHIFIYYTDHGGPGVLGMPTSPYIYADNLIDVLKKKHASGTYKSLVFYLEACESGSIFEGLLPEGLNIYATTASNAEESSWGTYCPGEYPSPPVTCIVLPGWRTVTSTTCRHKLCGSSMNWLKIELQMTILLMVPMSCNMAIWALTQTIFSCIWAQILQMITTLLWMTTFCNHLQDQKLLTSVMLIFYISGTRQFQKAPEGSPRKLKAQKELVEAVSHRMHIDNSMKMIGKRLFGIEKGSEVLQTVRPGRAASC